MRLWLKLIIVLLAMCLVGCGEHRVHGDGRVITKSRSLAEFNRISVGGVFRVHVGVGKKQTVQITTDSNVEPIIVTRVQKGLLRIHSLPGYSAVTAKPPQVNITVKTLNGIDLSGNNYVMVSHIKSDNFTLRMSGSGKAELSGRADKFKVRILGSGDVDAKQLLADVVDVEISGSGNAKVAAHKSLAIKIFGSGNLSYSGSAPIVEQKISGTGRIKKED